MSLMDRIGRQAELCAAMLRRLRIDPVEAARITLGAHMQGIARTCMLCRHSAECETWLRSSAPDSMAYRDFCPNAEKLDRTHGLLTMAGRAG